MPLESKAFRWIPLLFLLGCSSAPTSDDLQPNGPLQSFLEIQGGIRLEVLDWGGTGPPLILLAGASRTAHAFEGLAPHFTDRRAVVGLTRRRVGPSDAPSQEFGLEELVGDIIALLDSRGIRQADFMGHSFGGAELSFLALHHPERIRKAVFLDGGWDFYEIYHAEGWWDPWPSVPMTAADSASAQAVASYFARTTGVLLPVGEIRAAHRFDPSGKLVKLSPNVGDMFQGMIRDRLTPLEYRGISVPVLSVRAVPEQIQDFFPRFEHYDMENRRLAQGAYRRWMDVVVPGSARFVAEVPGARELVIAGGHHEVPILHPDQIVPAVRAFLFE